MGCLIRMNSEIFISEFLREFNPKDFQFILVSENITSNKKYKNVMSIMALIPPPNIVQLYINEGMSKSYQKKYIDYLKKREINALVSIIVKAVLNGMNIVIMCSKSEDEFKYLNMLCKFVEKEYKLKTYSYKKFVKNPKKATKLKNTEEVVSILMKKMEKLHNVEGIDINPDINKEKFIKKVKKLSRKDLYRYCKNKIKVNKDMGKKKIIKKLKKKIFKK